MSTPPVKGGSSPENSQLVLIAQILTSACQTQGNSYEFDASFIQAMLGDLSYSKLKKIVEELKNTSTAMLADAAENIFDFFQNLANRITSVSPPQPKATSRPSAPTPDQGGPQLPTQPTDDDFAKALESLAAQEGGYLSVANDQGNDPGSQQLPPVSGFTGFSGNQLPNYSQTQQLSSALTLEIEQLSQKLIKLQALYEKQTGEYFDFDGAAQTYQKMEKIEATLSEKRAQMFNQSANLAPNLGPASATNAVDDDECTPAEHAFYALEGDIEFHEKMKKGAQEAISNTKAQIEDLEKVRNEVNKSEIDPKIAELKTNLLAFQDELNKISNLLDEEHLELEGVRALIDSQKATSTNDSDKLLASQYETINALKEKIAQAESSLVKANNDLNPLYEKQQRLLNEYENITDEKQLKRNQEETTALGKKISSLIDIRNKIENELEEFQDQLKNEKNFLVSVESSEKTITNQELEACLGQLLHQPQNWLAFLESNSSIEKKLTESALGALFGMLINHPNFHAVSLIKILEIMSQTIKTPSSNLVVQIESALSNPTTFNQLRENPFFIQRIYNAMGLKQSLFNKSFRLKFLRYLLKSREFNKPLEKALKDLGLTSDDFLQFAKKQGDFKPEFQARFAEYSAQLNKISQDQTISSKKPPSSSQQQPATYTINLDVLALKILNDDPIDLNLNLNLTSEELLKLLTMFVEQDNYIPLSTHSVITLLNLICSLSERLDVSKPLVELYKLSLFNLDVAQLNLENSSIASTLIELVKIYKNYPSFFNDKNSKLLENAFYKLLKISQDLTQTLKLLSGELPHDIVAMLIELSKTDPALFTEKQKTLLEKSLSDRKTNPLNTADVFNHLIYHISTNNLQAFTSAVAQIPSSNLLATLSQLNSNGLNLFELAQTENLSSIIDHFLSSPHILLMTFGINPNGPIETVVNLQPNEKESEKDYQQRVNRAKKEALEKYKKILEKTLQFISRLAKPDKYIRFYFEVLKKQLFDLNNAFNNIKAHKTSEIENNLSQIEIELDQLNGQEIKLTELFVDNDQVPDFTTPQIFTSEIIEGHNLVVNLDQTSVIFTAPNGNTLTAHLDFPNLNSLNPYNSNGNLSLINAEGNLVAAAQVTFNDTSASIEFSEELNETTNIHNLIAIQMLKNIFADTDGSSDINLKRAFSVLKLQLIDAQRKILEKRHKEAQKELKKIKDTLKIKENKNLENELNQLIQSLKTSIENIQKVEAKPTQDNPLVAAMSNILDNCINMIKKIINAQINKISTFHLNEESTIDKAIEEFKAGLPLTDPNKAPNSPAFSDGDSKEGLVESLFDLRTPSPGDDPDDHLFSSESDNEIATSSPINSQSNFEKLKDLVLNNENNHIFGQLFFDANLKIDEIINLVIVAITSGNQNCFEAMFNLSTLLENITDNDLQKIVTKIKEANSDEIFEILLTLLEDSSETRRNKVKEWYAKT